MPGSLAGGHHSTANVLIHLRTGINSPLQILTVTFFVFNWKNLFAKFANNTCMKSNMRASTIQSTTVTQHVCITKRCFFYSLSKKEEFKSCNAVNQCFPLIVIALVSLSILVFLVCNIAPTLRLQHCRLLQPCYWAASIVSLQQLRKADGYMLALQLRINPPTKSCREKGTCWNTQGHLKKKIFKTLLPLAEITSCLFP